MESSPSETEARSIHRGWSKPADQQPRVAAHSGLRHRGLRWKFNVALLPVVTIAVLLLAWMDSQHERQAVTAAHALHVAGAGADAAAAPVDPATSPEAVARRSTLVHAIFAAALLLVLAFALNAALSRFVLQPIDLIRDGIEKMERGHWRLSLRPARHDEVGRVVESFQMLGLRVDALVGQLIRAERLATLALVATKTTAQIEPRVQRIGAAVGRLYERQDDVGREAAEEIAIASAEILAAVRGLDGAFEANLSSTRIERRRSC